MPARRRGGIDTHRVERSLQRMTVGTTLRHQERQKRHDEIKATETDHQFKIRVSGLAGSDLGWFNTDIIFEEEIAPAASRRDSEFDLPFVTFGYEMESGTPVMLTVCVLKWLPGNGGLTVRGANVGIGVCIPGATDQFKFSAIAHIVFQGWSAPWVPDDDEGAM